MIGISVTRVLEEIPYIWHLVSWGILSAVGLISFFAILGNRKQNESLYDFGRWHASPQARTWDAIYWIVRGHGTRRFGSLFHLFLVAAVPLFSALTADFSDLTKGDTAIYFSVSALVSGVLIESLESTIRNEEYAQKTSGTLPTPVPNRSDKRKTDYNELSSEQKLAITASWFALGEWLLGILVMVLAFKGLLPTFWMPAVLLGFAFVALADAMSVGSTWLLVKWRGSPFIRTGKQKRSRPKTAT
jgi:hypothetical protein